MHGINKPLKMNLKVIVFLFPILAALLVACDPMIHHKKVIENNSDYDLTVRIYSDSLSWPNMYSANIFTIPSKTEMVIAEMSEIGNINEFSACLIMCDSIVPALSNYPNAEVHLDFSESSNWTHAQLRKRTMGGGETECRIRVGNSSIEF